MIQPVNLRTAFRAHDAVGLGLALPAAFAGFFWTSFAVAATRFCCDAAASFLLLGFFFACRTGRFVGFGTGLGVGFALSTGFGAGLMTLAAGGGGGGAGGGGEGDAGGGLGPTPSSTVSCCGVGILDGDRNVAHAHCIRITCPGVRPW